jgi:hypothetical protein
MDQYPDDPKTKIPVLFMIENFLSEWAIRFHFR